MKDNELALLELIAQTLYNKKGFNILVLDVHKFSTLTRYYVIAEGNVERHVKSLAKELIDTLADNGVKLFQVDAASPDWIVLDFAEVIVHIMVPETREHYSLEELWRQADLVDVNIITK